MNIQAQQARFFWYALAAFTLAAGWLAAGGLFLRTLRAYPKAIGAAYAGPRQELEAPGTVELELSRTGAYGIYYEGQTGPYVHAEMPPRLDCRLAVQATGAELPLAPDYVPGNRYSTADGRVGVLIYSTTVQEPGMYTFTCDDPLATRGTRHHLAIGPNYVFEFLRVAGRLGLALLAPLAVVAGTTLLAIIIAGSAFITGRRRGRGLWENAG